MSGDYDGIILRTVNYGEGNKIIEIFTKEKGKLTAVARNAREFKKMKGNISEPFCRLNANLVEGKKFYYLNQSSIIESYQGIREDIDRMFIAAYISEITCSALEDEQENEKLYELLNKTFRLMSEKEINPVKLMFSYQIKFLSFIGFKPFLKLYDSEAQPPYFFNYEDGGIISGRHEKNFNYKIETEPDIIKILVKFLYSKLEDLDEIEMDDYQKIKIGHILHSYMVFHTGKQNYKSLKNLKSMNII